MQAHIGDVILMSVVILCSTVGSVVNACIQSNRIANTCEHSWCSFVTCANVPLITYVQEMNHENADVNTFSTRCGYVHTSQSETVSTASTASTSSASSTSGSSNHSEAEPIDISTPSSSASSIGQQYNPSTSTSIAAPLTHDCMLGTVPAGTQRDSIISDYMQSTCFIQFDLYDDECTRTISTDGNPIREIMDLTASTLSRRACGKWIDAHATSRTIYSYTFNRDLDRRMYHHQNQLCIESTTNTADGSHTPLIYYQLHQTCDAHFALTSAQRKQQMQLGLDSLMHYMGFSRQPDQPYVNDNSLTTVNHLAKNVGLLTSFGCSSFVDSAVDIDSDSIRLIPYISDGELPSRQEMLEYGVDDVTISEFDKFTEYRNRIDPFTTNYDSMCGVDTRAVINEFINGLTHTTYILDVFQAQQLAQSTPSLMAFVCYSMKSGAFDRYKVSLLLYGASKVCVQRYTDHIEAALAPTDASALMLYRMRRNDADLFDAPSSFEMRMASSVGLSRLRVSNANALITTSQDSLIDGCFNVMQKMLPTLTERALYDHMISDTLVSKLATVIQTVRSNVVQIFSDTELPIRELLVDAEFTVNLAKTVRIYFKGSEDTSMFGDNPSIVELQFDGSRGFVNAVMNSVLERNVRMMNDAFSERNPCEFPNMFELTSANAYYIRNANCIHVMLGLLQPPFAHEMYDVRRLTRLFGFYIAHEIAHTAHTRGVKNAGKTDVILGSYQLSNLYHEGFADMVAILAVQMAMPDTLQDCEDVWNSFAQTFCSSSVVQHTIDDTHPFGNTRVDALWNTVKRHFDPKYTCNR